MAKICGIGTDFQPLIGPLLTFSGLSLAVLTWRLGATNSFVDIRKKEIRDLLRDEIRTVPELTLLVQQLGKTPAAEFFGAELLRPFNAAAAALADEIRELRTTYTRAYWSGIALLVVWGLGLLTVTGCAAVLGVTGGIEAIYGLILALASGWILFVGFHLYPGAMNFFRSHETVDAYIDAVAAHLYQRTFKDRNRIALGGDDQARRFLRRYIAVVDAVRAHAATADPTVLDLGCGDGMFAKLVADHVPAARVVGVDVSELSLSFAARNAPKARFAVADLRRLAADSRDVTGPDHPPDPIEFVSRTRIFDFVVLIEVVEHYRNARALVELARDRTRVGGIVVVTVPMLESDSNRKSAEKAGPVLTVKRPFDSLALDHFWRDPESGVRLPHRLYSWCAAATLVTNIDGLEAALPVPIRSGPGDLAPDTYMLVLRRTPMKEGVALSRWDPQTTRERTDAGAT